MFLDKVLINIKAGNGGNGHVSFFRDKLTMRGGPDGGDGGNGGDIIFVGTTREDNLINFRFTKKFKAEDGKHGSKRHRTGARGEALYIRVPLGTRIYKLVGSDKKLLADITAEDQEFLALKGGAGGKGNAFYATAKKQTPNFSQTGVITKEYEVLLELNSIADVGLVGFPNVGKSTLLSVISRANPKIASYHFTTLHPNIAVTNILDKNLIVADIPGLIEGASLGVGLGHDFLKHIRRTQVLIHVIDISEQEGRSAVEDFKIINKELVSYSEELGTRPQVIALNKCDVATPEQIKKFKSAMPKGTKVFEISAATTQGVKELLQYTATVVMKTPKPDLGVVNSVLEEAVDKNKFEIEQIKGEFFITGPLVDNLSRGVVLTDTESNSYFQKRLISSGIIARLKELGVKEGDIIHVGGIEFEFIE